MSNDSFTPFAQCSLFATCNLLSSLAAARFPAAELQSIARSLAGGAGLWLAVQGVQGLPGEVPISLTAGKVPMLQEWEAWDVGSRLCL